MVKYRNKSLLKCVRLNSPILASFFYLHMHPLAKYLKLDYLCIHYVYRYVIIMCVFVICVPMHIILWCDVNIILFVYLKSTVKKPSQGLCRCRVLQIGDRYNKPTTMPSLTIIAINLSIAKLHSARAETDPGRGYNWSVRFAIHAL